MKLTQHVGKTLRESPKDAQIPSHSLLLRAGFIHQLAAGIYVYMPLLTKTLEKICKIIREEMIAAGAQELIMPALQPAELWIESGRWERYTAIDGIMFAFKDRRGSMICLGPTHEEVITALMRKEISSYKDLPKCVFQIQTKFRDEIRPRFGLMRAREFIMKDAYSFDIDEAGMNRSYEAMRQAYHRICQRIGFNYREVEADPGAIGGSCSHEFMVLANTGEETLLYCDKCNYAANQEHASSRLIEYPQDSQMLPMQEVFGEGLIGVEPLAKFLNIPVWKTTKTLLYKADEQLVAVMVRGDCEVNEIKLARHLGCKQLRLLTPEEIKELTGAEVGYAGPLGLPSSFKIIADRYVAGRINFECGANKTNYHIINVNFGRDLPLPELGDFKLAVAGHSCPKCDGILQEAKGIEIGHIFKLGTKYSEPMGCTYLDSLGQRKYVYMGCYGIGVTRIAAAWVEQSHDNQGIIWSAAITPYHIHLVALNLEDKTVKEEADRCYQFLQSKGIEVLYDDRDLRAGEKFIDADLIGIPIRITISQRTVKQNKIELRWRKTGVTELLTLNEALDKIYAFYDLKYNS